MLTVEFGQEKGILCLSGEGHAGKAPKGQDLVCAAASILAYTVDYGLRQMQKEGKLDGEYFSCVAPGDVMFICKPKPEHLTEARHMFGTVLYGYYALQESYPEAVKVLPIEDDSEEDPNKTKKEEKE